MAAWGTSDLVLRYLEVRRGGGGVGMGGRGGGGEGLFTTVHYMFTYSV